MVQAQQARVLADEKEKRREEAAGEVDIEMVGDRFTDDEGVRRLSFFFSISFFATCTSLLISTIFFSLFFSRWQEEEDEDEDEGWDQGWDQVSGWLVLWCVELI